MSKIGAILFLVFMVCSGLQNHATKQASEEIIKPQTNALLTEEPQAKSFYFSHAIIYEYYEEGEKKQLWFYVNNKTKQVLYEPEDAMLEAVISFPDGTYKTYGQTENGEKLIFTEKVDFVANKNHTITAPIPNKKIMVIKKTTALDSILCKGYFIKYEQMEGGEEFFVTEQMPVNSYQIYGFCFLDGDAKINLPLDFSNVLSKKQLPSHIANGDSFIKLIDYSVSPYWFSTDGYKAAK